MALKAATRQKFFDEAKPEDFSALVGLGKNNKRQTEDEKDSTQLSSAQPDSNQTHKSHSSDSSKTQIRPEPDSNQTHESHSLDSSKTQVRPEPDSKQQHDRTQSRLNTSTYEALEYLTGAQQLLAHNMIGICINRGTLTTGHITHKELQKTFVDDDRFSAMTVKTALYRLMDKKIIHRIKCHSGVYAFSEFEITEAMRNAYVDLTKQDSNKTQIRLDTIKEQDSNKTQNESAPLSINSSSNITTIIDCEPLKKFGMDERKANQILKRGVDPQALQESIDQAGFDKEYNNPKVNEGSSFIDKFMGIMLTNGYYNAPANYKTLAQRSVDAQLKAQKQRTEELKKTKTELENKQLEEWELEQGEEGIAKIIQAAKIDPKMPKKIREIQRAEVLMKTFKEQK